MWYRALAFAALLLSLANSGFAAVAYNSAGSVGGAGVSSLSFNLSTAGSDRALAGNAMAYDGATCSISSMTYNAVALTNIGSTSVNDGSATLRVNQRQLVAPATGSNTFQVNFGGGGADCADLAISAVSMTGVDPTTPIGTQASANGTGNTLSVNVTSTTDELVVDSFSSQWLGVFSVGAGQTQRANVQGSNGFLRHGSSTEAGAASVTMSWTTSGGPVWVIAGTPFKPVSAGAPATRFRTLMGVGQ
jgi:hypothetical protein